MPIQRYALITHCYTTPSWIFMNNVLTVMNNLFLMANVPDSCLINRIFQISVFRKHSGKESPFAASS